MDEELARLEAEACEAEPSDTEETFEYVRSAEKIERSCNQQWRGGVVGMKMSSRARGWRNGFNITQGSTIAAANAPRSKASQLCFLAKA